MSQPDDGAWFAPKSFGYGAGMPIAWQGWVLLAAMIVVSTALALLCARMLPPLLLTLAVLAANGPFILLARAKTRGGWTWRNGRD